MATKFKEEKFGEPEVTVIRISRKQIEQMCKMAEHFKDLDDFELRVSSRNGIGQELHFAFDIDLTDVSKW